MTDRILAHRHRLVTDENSRWWTLGAMCFALFMVMLDNTVVNVALPSIQRDLHASLSALEWTVNAYTLTFAVLMITGGRLGDIFGRRKFFLFGVVVFGLSSAAIGFAPSDTLLVAFRAVQGIGAAFMMPATLSIITQAFPPQQRGMAIGTWAGVSAMALAIGPVIGGFLTQDVSWRAIFFINPPIAALAVAVTLFAARETRDETVDRTVDVGGIVRDHDRPRGARAGARRGQHVALGFDQDHRPRSVVAVIALVAFVLIERRHRAPMVNFEFFRSRSFAGANVCRVHRDVRDARPVLLPGAVHAELPALLAASGGSAVPALDARDHRDGPDRGQARRSDRVATADDPRTCCWSPAHCSCSRG